MRPVLFHVGGMSFHSYTVMLSLAFLVGTILTVRANFRRERPFPITTMAGVWAFAGGLLGAKVWFWAQYGEWADLKWGWFLVEGGLVFFGGLVGGVAAVLLYLRCVGAPVIPVSDLALPYVALAHGVARVGCFLNGCCHGSPTGAPWGVPYPKSSWGAYHRQLVDGLITREAGASLPIHPVQLYETLGLVVVFLVLRLVYRRSPRAGTVTLGYLAGYGGLRFCTEFFRGESVRHAPGFTVSQYVALGMLVAGVGGLVRLWARGGAKIVKTAEPPVAPEAAEEEEIPGAP